jgi:hypothetical protein
MRIFERLRDEHWYGGGITVVRDYVHEQGQRQREMFIPLSHDLGTRSLTSARRWR